MIQEYLKTSLVFHQFSSGDTTEVAAQILHYYDGCCQNVYAPKTDLRHVIPFQFLVPNEGVVTAWINDAETNTLVNPTPAAVTDLAANHLDVRSDATRTWYIYEGITQLAADLPVGFYYLLFRVNPAGAPDTTWHMSEVFQVCDFTVDFDDNSFADVCHDQNDSDGLLMLEWWADCDFDDIVYQEGFRNRLYFDAQLEHPIEEITKDTLETLGIMKPNSIVVKKKYQFKVLIPEWVWNALIRLPIYGSNLRDFYATLTVPGYFTGGTQRVTPYCAEMSETDILGEWQEANCVNKFTIQFMDEEYPVVGTNCCDDYSIT